MAAHLLDYGYWHALTESLNDIQPFWDKVVINTNQEEKMTDLGGQRTIPCWRKENLATGQMWDIDVNQEEKMTEFIYKLRNGMKAQIDSNGMGYTEDSTTLRSWIVTDNEEVYFRGGVLGNGYDAVTIFSIAPQLYQYPTSKESNMAENNQDGFVSIDYYNGYPIKDLSDERIFEIIRKEQEKLATLDKLPVGTATNAHQARIESNISKLMAAVNARHSE